MRHEDLHEEDWKEEAPLLASLDRNVATDAPDGYFEGLPASVLARIRNLSIEEVSEGEPVGVQALPANPPRVFAFRRTMFWSMAAGIALLVAVGTYFLSRPTTGGEDTMAWEAIDAQTLVQLASLERNEIAPNLDVTYLTDEQLFQALGSEGAAAFEDQDHAVDHDEAAEYLQGLDLDDIDLQDLDIDLSNI
jgi:hypothetical protein